MTNAVDTREACVRKILDQDRAVCVGAHLERHRDRAGLLVTALMAAPMLAVLCATVLTESAGRTAWWIIFSVLALAIALLLSLLARELRQVARYGRADDGGRVWEG